LALYRGDLLDGFFISDAPEFERWLDGERARLRGRAALSAWALAEAHEKRGEMSEAAERARQAAALAPGDERSLRRLVSLENISPVSVAILYCKLGEWDKAFAWLERAADERDPAIVELKQEPLLDPLRSDQRFARLAERVGLP